MQASPGDRLIVPGHSVGQAARDGVIVDVRGRDGGAPYVVRWSSDGHEGLFFPGPDAVIQHEAGASST